MSKPPSSNFTEDLRVEARETSSETPLSTRLDDLCVLAEQVTLVR